MLLTRAQAYAFGILAAILLVTTIGLSLHIWGFRIGPIGFDGLKGKLADCARDRNELRALVDEAARKSRDLQAEVDRRVPRVIERVRDNPEARRVETAPLPGNCETPPAILSADL